VKPVLTIFMDGLKADSLEYMPFLDSFAHKRRLKTILGYSAACHASMYTGVYPDQHHLWFLWLKSPETSPFKWTRPLGKIRPLDNLFTRLLLHRVTTLFEHPTSFFGIPRIVNLPLKYWPRIDVSEKKLCDEPQYLETYPTLFDILRDRSVEFEIVGMKREPGIRDESIVVERHEYTRPKPWIYLFMGDVDHFSHELGQDSGEAVEKLKRLDRLFEMKYKEFERLAGDFSFIFFSDHGHIRTKKKIDIHDFFKRRGDNLRNHFHIVDANYIRFWFRNDRERALVESILAELDQGFVLTEDILKSYRVNMPDNRYGDLIFYLKAGCIFSKTIWGFGRSIRSMHGYLPDHSDSDGLFVSNREISEDVEHVRLVDIFPTHLNLLGLPAPDYVQGNDVLR
jgi:predicted AlkP superfamily pyrophosphatase or phosphodiesterase